MNAPFLLVYARTSHTTSLHLLYRTLTDQTAPRTHLARRGRRRSRGLRASYQRHILPAAQQHVNAPPRIAPLPHAITQRITLLKRRHKRASWHFTLAATARLAPDRWRLSYGCLAYRAGAKKTLSAALQRVSLLRNKRGLSCASLYAHRAANIWRNVARRGDIARLYRFCRRDFALPRMARRVWFMLLIWQTARQHSRWRCGNKNVNGWRHNHAQHLTKKIISGHNQ